MTVTVIPARFAPYLQGVLRIVLGLLLIPHGTAKFFAVPHVAMFDTFKPFSLLGAAGAIEIVGGALFLIGFLTRPVAFLLSGFMAFAYFIGHASQGFLPLVNKGELAVVYCFVFLFFAAAGPGRFAVDKE